MTKPPPISNLFNEIYPPIPRCDDCDEGAIIWAVGNVEYTVTRSLQNGGGLRPDGPNLKGNPWRRLELDAEHRGQMHWLQARPISDRVWWRNRTNFDGLNLRRTEKKS
ncbi:hypothetical protein [Bradyrhizobium lablabi]|uniref:hypothetical protein n=1 Tax=Bradyrhizobium lablabi TaxID=722472 RepID=UPI00090BB64F|nr:hypothetical protein [Bradyrhizobium lablabi]SHL14908.1 hypothetical protein SAMN05444321_1913 [Bradyrhizobium lablabi]